MNEITEWFQARMPAEWFTEVEVGADRDEILVRGTLAGVGPDTSVTEEREAIAAFRDRTRQARMEIAGEAEHLFNRKVSWGASAGSTRVLFTHLSVPVMTRLRLPERMVLDTLVGAGVARSRSDALAWCARLVAQHEADWLARLREAAAGVDEVRRAGPAA